MKTQKYEGKEVPSLKVSLSHHVFVSKSMIFDFGSIRKQYFEIFTHWHDKIGTFKLDSSLRMNLKVYVF